MIEPKLRFKADDGSQFPDWEEHNFGDLYKVCSGYAFKYENYCASGVALVNGQAIQHGWIDDNNMNYLPETFLQQYKDFVLKENDIVLGLNRPITNGKLKIARVPKEYNNSLLYQRAGKIVCKKAVDDDFSYALLAREIFKFTIKEAAGSDQPFISTSKLNNWKIIVPSSEQEQQKIAEFLSTIDTVIAKQKETVSAWEERKKGVMQKLFGQEVRFKADDGSEFPEWEEKSYLSICNVFADGDWIESKDQSDSGIRLIQTGNIGNGVFIDKDDKKKYISKETFDRLKCNEVFEGDILISRLPSPAGRACIVPKLNERMITAVDCTIVRTDKSIILHDYCVQFMQSSKHFYYVASMMAGGTRQRISRKNLEDELISVPCLEEQQKIADCLSSLDEVIENQKATLAAWEELKKGLLQQMFV